MVYHWQDHLDLSFFLVLDEPSCHTHTNTQIVQCALDISRSCIGHFLFDVPFYFSIVYDCSDFRLVSCPFFPVLIILHCFPPLHIFLYSNRLVTIRYTSTMALDTELRRLHSKNRLFHPSFEFLYSNIDERGEWEGRGRGPRPCGRQYVVCVYVHMWRQWSLLSVSNLSLLTQKCNKSLHYGCLLLSIPKCVYKHLPM